MSKQSRRRNKDKKRTEFKRLRDLRDRMSHRTMGKLGGPKTKDSTKAAATPPQLRPVPAKTPTMERPPMRQGQLRFSPRAWAKLVWMRDRSTNEVGAFGITPPDDALFIQDIKLVKQRVSPGSFEFDDDALAAYQLDMSRGGMQPYQYMRVWIHTHPSGVDGPSGKDEETFDRTVMGSWGIMAILTREGVFYGRLRIKTQHGGLYTDTKLSYKIELSGGFDGVGTQDIATWEAEYQACVSEYYYTIPVSSTAGDVSYPPQRWAESDRDDYYREIYGGYDRSYAGYEQRMEHFGRERDKVGADLTRADERPREAHVVDDDTCKPEQMRLIDRDEEDDVPVPEPSWERHFQEQKVMLVDPADPEVSVDDIYIYTSDFWFRYKAGTEVAVEIDNIVQCLSDISLDQPTTWGGLEWHESTDKQFVHPQITTVFIDDRMVRANEEGLPLADPPKASGASAGAGTAVSAAAAQSVAAAGGGSGAQSAAAVGAAGGQAPQ